MTALLAISPAPRGEGGNMPSSKEARRFSRQALEDVVAPEPLEQVLRTLVQVGALHSFEVRGAEVFIVGDEHAIGVALELVPDAPREDEHLDHRAEYYRACEAFVHTPGFRRLPVQNRAIWKLHAQGVSHALIATKLRVSPMLVRNAVKGARMAAQLPQVTSVMPRGTPAAPRASCSEAGCTTQVRARGLCMVHYLRARRRGMR